MRGNPRAFVGPWKSVQDVALLKPASASASPAPGGAVNTMETDPWQVWGGWRARAPRPGQAWTGSLSRDRPHPHPRSLVSEVRIINTCLCPISSGGVGVGKPGFPGVPASPCDLPDSCPGPVSSLLGHLVAALFPSPCPPTCP